MPGGTTRRLVAALLSAVLPGAGQLFVGARRRGLVLLAISASLLLALLALVSAASLTQVDRQLIAGVLAIDFALFAFRLFAVADAWRGGGAAGLAALSVLVAAPHVAAGYVTLRGYDTLEDVFAEEEPRDVLPARGVFLIEAEPEVELAAIPSSPPKEPAPDWPKAERPLARSIQVVDDDAKAERPWTTILLLGTDEGPGNWGARTDTIILVAAQHGTGRAAAFGIPRNLAQVPIGENPKPFREPLNALYGFAQTKPELFPGGSDPGATALKQAVSRLLGIRVDYYALVNLRGFADLVDALGGVRIHVKERLVDSVTRPAWGEPKPRIDVRPGEVRRFYGREALAYVRSRKDSSDYTRMARQRCFLSALGDQLDPVRVLRSFGSLTSIVEKNVSTDLPLNRLPRLIRLVAGVEPAKTITLTFGLDYFFGRRKRDNHPVPNASKIRRTVEQALLAPELLRVRGGAPTAGYAC
jgi:LCP family protein required for cell wall assembly